MSLSAWFKVGVAAGAGMLTISIVAVVLGTWIWSRGTARAEQELSQATLPAGSGDQEVDPSRDSLPAPVARYFDFALAPEFRQIRRAHIDWRGTFRTDIKAKWSPYTATQLYSLDPPGFVWDAKIRMIPFLPVRVRDVYTNGRGSMQGRMAGVIPVVDQSGSPEMNSGALLRYLAECVWAPSALLPSTSVRWSAIDDSSARVSLSDAGVTVSLTVHFAKNGEIVRAEGMRHREVKSSFVLTSWVGQYADYGEIEGMMIPMRGEVAWMLPEGRLTYWRGMVKKADYEFVP